jgi:hypothetical protein
MNADTQIGNCLPRITTDKNGSLLITSNSVGTSGDRNF